MTTEPIKEQRWPWWGQFRDAVALTIGTILVAVSVIRDNYDPLAMAFAAVCLGIVGSGVLGRFLIGKWEQP